MLTCWLCLFNFQDPAGTGWALFEGFGRTLRQSSTGLCTGNVYLMNFTCIRINIALSVQCAFCHFFCYSFLRIGGKTKEIQLNLFDTENESILLYNFEHKLFLFNEMHIIKFCVLHFYSVKQTVGSFWGRKWKIKTRFPHTKSLFTQTYSILCTMRIIHIPSISFRVKCSAFSAHSLRRNSGSTMFLKKIQSYLLIDSIT